LRTDAILSISESRYINPKKGKGGRGGRGKGRGGRGGRRDGPARAQEMLKAPMMKPSTTNCWPDWGWKKVMRPLQGRKGGREGGREGREGRVGYHGRGGGTTVMKVLLSMLAREEGRSEGARAGSRGGKQKEGGKPGGREGKKPPARHTHVPPTLHVIRGRVPNDVKDEAADGADVEDS